MSLFKKAERKQVKLKLAITGPSGGGKTYSGLKIAQGLARGGKIAVIDTENGSASLYSDTPGMPEYDTIDLGPPFTSERYMTLIRGAEKEGYTVLLIDSISHQWNGEGGINDRMDKEKISRPNVNSFTLWAKFTPEHERFKQCILQTPIHIIATIRSKQGYIMETNDKGKQTPRKVGMAPIQRDGAEYDFTTVLDMNMDHHAQVSKDRTGLFKGEVFQPGEDTGVRILEWLSSGKEFIEPWAYNAKALDHLKALADLIKWDGTRVMKECHSLHKKRMDQMNESEYQALVHLMSSHLPKEEPSGPPLAPISKEFQEAMNDTPDPRDGIK